MPTWGEELQELNELKRNHDRTKGVGPHDILRRKYLRALSRKTERATIVYATDYLSNRDEVPPQDLSIVLGDVQGFMEAVSNISERELDLIIHSPGGSPEAAESIVEYLRTRFDHIRAIVPVAAMSAATMICLAADEIVMGSHSQLGPIDPQFTVFTPEGPRSAPGQAILDQFELAKQECQDPRNLGAWLPLLRSLLPGLIAQCQHQRQLAEQVVANWMQRYMFADVEDGAQKAKSVAAWFANFSWFKSHGRRVSREQAREQGVKVVDLETAPDDLQDAVLSVHHAVNHTFSDTGTTKIIENHYGRAFLQIRQALVPLQVAQPPQQTPAISPPSGQPQPMNRAERRRRERETGKKRSG